MTVDYTGWYRVGGHRVQFYATDEEIVEWLVETLTAEFAPYDLVGTDWSDGRWIPFSLPLEELAAAVKTQRRSTNWWIRSQALSPSVPAGDDERQSFSGLILVQFGHERDGRLWDASIAVVDRIRHQVTGEERRQPEYMRIFERLRRSMRKRLVVTTLCTFPDGSVSESWRMTARAADAHARGEVRFWAEPAGLLP